jgi:hypothetical protein
VRVLLENVLEAFLYESHDGQEAVMQHWRRQWQSIKTVVETKKSNAKVAEQGKGFFYRCTMKPWLL